MARFRRANSRVIQFDANNLHLVCLDCKRGQPDLLDQVTVPQTLVQEIAETTGMNEETVSPMLRSFLKKYGVLVALWRKGKRIYWVPGIGRFRVKGSEVVRAYFFPQPELIVQEQKRTRGLPKPKSI